MCSEKSLWPPRYVADLDKHVVQGICSTFWAQSKINFAFTFLLIILYFSSETLTVFHKKGQNKSVQAALDTSRYYIILYITFIST